MASSTHDDHPTESASTTASDADVRTAIADAVTAATGRQDLLVEYARELGPDPTLDHLADDEVEDAVGVGEAEIAAATARWLTHLAELVVRGVWAVDGATTPAAWLSWALGMAPSTAREHIRVALRLRECPAVHARMAAGRLSYSKVRAITRVATPATEQLLLDWADAAPAHVLERIIRDTRRVQQAGSATTERDDLGVQRRWREDGTYELVLRVDAGTGLQIEQHLDRLAELDTGEEAADRATSDRETPAAPLPRRLREADLVAGALAAAVEAAPDDISGADRHLVVMHTTPAELLAASAHAEQAADDPTGASAEAVRSTAVLARDGRGRVRAMSARTMWRLACSARLRVAVDHDGHPVDNGRARRAPDARLRRLVHQRDRTCRFPGCGATRYLHAHHVVHWEDGGATDLDNLVLLCGQHHRIVHTGWELRPAGRGRWTFHAPADTRTSDEARPWARELPGASAEAVNAAARAHAHDLAPTARERLLQPPNWDGLGYDHDLTVALLAQRLELAA